MLQSLQRLAASGLSPARAQTLGRVLAGAGSYKLMDITRGVTSSSAVQASPRGEASAKIPNPADQEFDRYDEAFASMNDMELQRRRGAAAAQRGEPEGVPLDRPVTMADLEVELDRDEGREMAVAEGLSQPYERLDPLGRPVDIEFDFDRDDPECVSMEELYSPKVRAALEEALGRPVDLEQEFDRDDPECVDLAELYSPKAKAAVMEALGRPVELDDEFDLIHEVEAPSGTMAGNVDMRTGEKAGPENVGQYRERGPKFDQV